MAKKCKHRKGIILAAAYDVKFEPDQEPFVSGKIESCGIDYIVAKSLFIHYCPKCEIATIESDGEWYCED